MKKNQDRDPLVRVARALARAAHPLALTGAGISVASGIPDFRSPGGLWSRFSPDEYATMEVFRRDPARAWQLFRAMAAILQDARPNPAHLALARLEQAGVLRGVITQNVDNLHQAAGSRDVLEIHGDHQHLQCLGCGRLEPADEAHYHMEEPPRCPDCGRVLKPNVVLFGEPVRHLEEIQARVAGCDLLLVIGTSAQVHPAAGLPRIVRAHGGLLVEFNRERALAPASDFFVAGPAERSLPRLVDLVLS